MQLRNMSKFPTRHFFLVSLFTLVSFSIGRDSLTPTPSLVDGETLVSAGRIFALGFFSPTNSKNRYIGIWYQNIPNQTVVWVANRQNPITNTTGRFTIDHDGTLTVINQNSTVLWSSSSSAARASNPVAQLLDNGNFVVREANSNDTERFLWQSFDHPTDTLLSGMKLGLNLITGLNRNLTSWRRDDDPSPGDYCVAMDIRGDPQLTIWAGSVRKLWTGPWNGIEFTGPPETSKLNVLIPIFINNKEEIYYSYNIIDMSTITRLVINNLGTAQQLRWVDSTSIWSLLWYSPMSQCDGSAICDPNSLPICSCLLGFEPKSVKDWSANDGTGGCVRKTELDCQNGTDGFMKESGALLPDTSNVTVSRDTSLDECRGLCLSNCSCTGYASADVRGNASGCIIWVSELVDVQFYKDGGQDLYVRLAAADLESILSQSSKSKLAIVAIIVSTISGTLLVICVGCCVWRKKRRRRAASSAPGEDDFDLPLFDLDTILAATNNFCIENKLGEGGFGPVYKGKLGEEQEIAVKRLSKTSVQGFDELKTEVKLIAKLQHTNLVRLVGCCIQGEERLLIYEYMPNKSLDAFLFDKAKAVLLDWKIRYRIITGIARGILYLHQDSRVKIIHRDLKASNILLDNEMNPKISDFGMARIFGGDETESKTRRVVGTYGYMPPEYVIDGIFSVKSDVFSFGVLVLEIISGQKNRGSPILLSEPQLYLLGHVSLEFMEGRSLELVDPSMGHSLPMTEVMKCIKVGLLCVQECSEDRPMMSSVVLMLGSNTSSLPEPKQPGFVAM